MSEGCGLTSESQWRGSRLGSGPRYGTVQSTGREMEKRGCCVLRSQHLGTTKDRWPRLVLVFPPDSDNPPRALCVCQAHTE